MSSIHSFFIDLYKMYPTDWDMYLHSPQAVEIFLYVNMKNSFQLEFKTNLRNIPLWIDVAKSHVHGLYLVKLTKRGYNNYQLLPEDVKQTLWFLTYELRELYDEHSSPLYYYTDNTTYIRTYRCRESHYHR